MKNIITMLAFFLFSKDATNEYIASRVPPPTLSSNRIVTLNESVSFNAIPPITGAIIHWKSPDDSTFVGYTWTRNMKDIKYFGAYKAYAEVRNRRGRIIKPDTATIIITPDTETRLVFVEIDFLTPKSNQNDDGKDWDTDISLNFYGKNEYLGTRKIEKSGEFKPDGSTKSFTKAFSPLPLDDIYVTVVHKKDLLNATMRISIQAKCPFGFNCSDVWFFSIPKLKLIFSDKSEATFSFPNVVKASAREYISPEFNLGNIQL